MKAIAAVCIAALLAGCGSKPDASTASAAPPQPIRITEVQAQVRNVPASFEETGSFVADESSDIAPPVAGRVLATPVDVGAFVQQGQVICELDHRDAQLKLQQAQAQLEEASAAVRQAQSRIGLGTGAFDPNQVPEAAAARANYESAQAQAKMATADSQRYANLVNTGDVSKSAYEKAHTQQETAEAQANAAKQQYEGALNAARQSYQIVSSSQASLASMRAQLAQAEKAVSDTTIRAPFDGYITARPVAAGEYVALTAKIATIVRIGTLKLQLLTPEQRASRAKVGMTVLARVSAYPDRDFTGKVSAINQSIDPNSRAFILEARFANPDGALRPGMFSTARVLLPAGEDAVFVPRQAVIRDKTTDSNQVYVVQGGKAHLRVVLTGESDGDQIRILSGLAAGDVVAIATQGSNQGSSEGSLYDGAPVDAVTGKAKARS
jgi:multidrug efflux pump subunit AcrA (membrane-fusion protein)